MQLSPYGLVLLTQPLQSSEQYIRANLEFSSNFEFAKDTDLCLIVKMLQTYRVIVNVTKTYL